MARTTQFQLPIQSFRDYEDGNYPIFTYPNGDASKAILHLSLCSYNKVLNVVFWSKPDSVYQYSLSYPVTFVRDFEAKAIELDSVGKAFVFFRNKPELYIFKCVKI